ncbi:hypothetical protein VOLCADRAFT_96465 [Volvox carteri f. nagariensis]|uniref:Uncharacterized protein n=1 Tax=Volvox carteri f. nagariensis TaxID=3068 RepID=D8UA66_VOLCA|nr:uncharacterized protein VOLCADRAFT_96465 [Volvox carteri f. nagariensis]EFJ43373.1 hypothetical protein VOLCADRAFT_96465 [Volvox carteri f. nagariensis]|eukprot:XP_002955520.1 hypothetical protein VOLCADRAFT_96465 [Volvox carteri f. nagariensis]
MTTHALATLKPPKQLKRVLAAHRVRVCLGIVTIRQALLSVGAVDAISPIVAALSESGYDVDAEVGGAFRQLDAEQVAGLTVDQQLALKAAIRVLVLYVACDSVTESAVAAAAPAAAAASMASAGEDMSEAYCEQLLLPVLDVAPRLEALYEFFCTPPVAKIPVLGEALSVLRGSSIAQHFVLARGKLALAVSDSICHNLEFGASKVWTVIAEQIVVVSLLQMLDKCMPVMARLGLVVQRDEGDPTSLMTVKSKDGRTLRPDGVLRDITGRVMLAKWEDNAGQLLVAINDLHMKNAAWTPLYYGDIAYLPCFAAAGMYLQFFAIPRGGVLTQQPHAISPVLDLSCAEERAHAVVMTIKFYQLLQAQRKLYPAYVLRAGTDLIARHPRGLFERAL